MPSLSKKVESSLGMLISQKFYNKHGKGATKVKVDYCVLPVNSYSVEFLESCIDDIIGFFTSSTPAVSDNG